ncbi:sialate O-acetylesterase [Sphingomonas sp. ASY06-1R]|uniref:sialate O-acetylesterase n=1 Tax=Sphingomonas sp. ASY06-1R TaxID=3445771 RepID=UPI003FA1B8FA
MAMRYWALTACSAFAFPLSSAPLLHPMFQDHGVLQRDAPIPIYGAAPAGSEVTVTLGRAVAHARADAGGHWQLALPKMAAGGPYTLQARTASGETQAAQDVLIGDVYLCSGQSNMAFAVRGADNAKADIAAATDPTIRSLTIETKDSLVPLDRFAAPVKWIPASPDTVGAFSASCYFFARERKRTVDVPIGMVVAAWGGSRIRAWVSEPGLRAARLEEANLDLLAQHRLQPEAADRGWSAVWEGWWRSLKLPGDPPWQPGFDAHDWKIAPTALGPWALWNGTSPDGFTGQMWLRTEVTLTAAQAAQPPILDLGVANEEDASWVNGTGVGGTSWTPQARHAIPRGTLHAGANTIVTNIFCSWRNCGLTGPAEGRALRLADGTTVPLAGPWRYAPMPADAIAPQLPWGPAHGVSVIYNGMIAPIGRYGFRAAVWYQGESDVHYAADYERNLRALMADWRRHFRADLPFLIVQLPNFGPMPVRPAESKMADIREAQRRAAIGDARADYIVTIDIGDPHDIHPTNKQDVGRRLALTAASLLDRRPVLTGPRGVRVTRNGQKIIVHFDNVSGALVSYTGAPVGFELCGVAAGSCRFVTASLAAPNAVILDAGSRRATRVRFCWGDSPACMLSDASRLPAGPFELPVH